MTVLVTVLICSPFPLPPSHPCLSPPFQIHQDGGEVDWEGKKVSSRTTTLRRCNATSGKRYYNTWSWARHVMFYKNSRSTVQGLTPLGVLWLGLLLNLYCVWHYFCIASRWNHISCVVISCEVWHRQSSDDNIRLSPAIIRKGWAWGLLHFSPGHLLKA